MGCRGIINLWETTKMGPGLGAARSLLLCPIDTCCKKHYHLSLSTCVTNQCVRPQRLAHRHTTHSDQTHVMTEKGRRGEGERCPPTSLALDPI